MLSDEDRETLEIGCSLFGWSDSETALRHLEPVVESMLDRAAQVAERALVERVKAAAESERFTGMNCACGHELNSPRGWLTHVLRTTALRPEAATTERRWDECLHGVTLGSVCLDCPSKWASIPARPAATTEEAVECADCASGRCVHACDWSRSCKSSAHYPTCPVRRQIDRDVQRILDEQEERGY